MARVTVFYVQPFSRAGPKKLTRGDLRQYADEPKARRAGEVAARRNAGAIVYSVEGNPEYEDWAPPRHIASFGDVPEMQFS